MNITIAQLNYTIGDFTNNYHKIRQIIFAHATSDLIVFSELAISGYYPYDLLNRKDFIQLQNEIITKLQALTKELNTSILIGAITENRNPTGKPLYNSAMLISNGNIEFEYHKHLLPIYNIHDEPRHFERGTNSPIFSLNNKKYAVLICEDIWNKEQQHYHDNPTNLLENEDLKALFILNASPSNIGKQEQRLELAYDLSTKFKIPVIYVNQVGGNDDIVYDGGSFICDHKGNIKEIEKQCFFHEYVESFNLNTLHKLPNMKYPQANLKLYFEQLMLGLKDYVHKSGFNGVVIGSSGGIDSALTLAIAKYALGAENVYAITMPSIYSSTGSVNDSIKLCENLGIKLFTRSIVEEFKLSCDAFADSFGSIPSKLTQENMQARIRGRIIMEYSNQYGVLAISTGNKSEMSVGYATLYGDMNGALNILGDLYKQDVYALSKYINLLYGLMIPESIINKEPSAELSENQKDSDSLPDYDILDAVLKLYLESDVLDADEIDKLKIQADKLNTEETLKIHKMVERSEFKRKQAPAIIRIQKRSFGIGRQVPVAHNFNLGHS